MHRLNEHIRFLGLDKSQIEAGRVAWTIIEPRMPRLIEDFYKHLFDIGLGAVFADHDIDRIQAAQMRYWQSLFSGDFANSYIQNVEHISKKHRTARIRYSEYIGTYAWLSTRFFDILAQSTPPKPHRRRTLIIAVSKIMHLDMMLAVASFEADVDDPYDLPAASPPGDRSAGTGSDVVEFE